MTSRNMLLENKNAKQRGFLCLPNHITNSKSNKVTNICGEPLHEDMGIYLGMQKNIMQYFSGVININLENITYDNLSLVHISDIKLFALK